MFRYLIALTTCVVSFVLFGGDADSDADSKDSIIEELKTGLHTLGKCRSAQSSEIKQEMTRLLARYEKSPSGLSKINEWKTYLKCQKALNRHHDELRRMLVTGREEQFLENTLMGLTQDNVTKSASQQYNSTHLKLATVMRENVRSFTRILSKSHSLGVPMRQAYNKCQEDKSEFLRLFLEELKIGYWHDSDFIKMLHYLKDYFLYEILLAKSDESNLRNYPGLTSFASEEFANRTVANFLVLYLVTPFLVIKQKMPAKIGQEISGKNGVALAYGDAKNEITEQTKIWQEIVALLLNYGDSEMRPIHLNRKASFTGRKKQKSEKVHTHKRSRSRVAIDGIGKTEATRGAHTRKKRTRAILNESGEIQDTDGAHSEGEGVATKVQWLTGEEDRIDDVLKDANMRQLKVEDLEQAARYTAEEYSSSALAAKNAKELDTMIRAYFKLVAKNSDLLSKTKNVIGNFVVALGNVKKTRNKEFVNANLVLSRLQDRLRSLPKWYIDFEKFDGNIEKYVNGFIFDGEWETKVNNFCILARLEMIHSRQKKDDILRISVQNIGWLLANYAHYLTVSDLYRLLKAYAIASMPLEFAYIEEMLKRINEFLPADKKESRFITNFRETTLYREREKQHGKKITRKYEENTSFEARTKDNKKKKKFEISMPIDRGLGKVVNNLMNVSWFSAVDQESLFDLARLVEVKSIESDEVLYKQGDIARSFAIIASGRLNVLHESEGNEQKIATLGRGQMVGEMAIFAADARRSATVKASPQKEASLLIISTNAFQKFMTENIDVLDAIVRQLVKKIEDGQEKLEVQGLPADTCPELFKGIEQSLFALFVCECAKSRNESFKEDEPSNKLCYVAKGRLKLTKNAIEQGLLQFGDCYDPISFLKKDGKYRYSMHVDSAFRGPCTILSISREKFDGFTKSNPEFLWALAGELSKMIKKNNDLLKQTTAYRFQKACEASNEEEIASLIKTVDIDAPIPLQSTSLAGFSPIHLAAKTGNIALLDILLKNGARTNAIDAHGNTPLHVAAAEGQLGAVKLLCDASIAELNMTNAALQTPLMRANEFRHHDVEEFLRRKGASLEIRLSSGLSEN